MKWLYQHKQDFYDSTQWPRAIVGFACVLIFLWMSLGMRWIWSTPTVHETYTKTTYTTQNSDPLQASELPSQNPLAPRSNTQAALPLASDGVNLSLPRETLALNASAARTKHLGIQPTLIF